MKNIFIPIIHNYHHNHTSGGSGDVSSSISLGLIVCILTLQIIYFIFTLTERDVASKYDRLGNRKEFILDLLIPFRGWFIWVINLFKNK